MILSKRLEAIANLVDEDSIVGDIGTDHGNLAIYLIKNKISKKVIATDISAGSLSKIETAVRMESLEEYIDCRVGDGLEPFKAYEVDNLVIAGMGGILISQILEAGRDIAGSINSFIFQPMVGIRELREYLINNGYKIIEEKIINEDRKFYEIIKAERGLDYFDKEIYYEIPRNLLKSRDESLLDYLDYRIEKLNRVVDSLKNSTSKEALKKREDLETMIRDFEEVKNECLIK